jgi:hypothetical protein
LGPAGYEAGVDRARPAPYAAMAGVASKHRQAGRHRGGLGRRRLPRVRPVLVALALLIGAVACGSSRPSAAAQAEQQAFLAQVHDAVPTINHLRSDSQLVGLGHAVCTGFEAGVSYEDLADRMSLQDGNLPTSVLGTVITSAGEHLCPKYSALVS